MKTQTKNTSPLGDYLVERKEIPKYDDVISGEIPIVSKVRFNDGTFEVRSSAETRTDLILSKPGDLLVSGINALKGAITLVPKEFNSNLAATIHYSSYSINEEKVNPKYLWNYLRSEAFRKRAITQLPNGIKTELKAKRLLSIEVPIPSKEEQEIIVSELEEKRELLGSIFQKRIYSSQTILGRRITMGGDARRILISRLAEMEVNIRGNSEMGTLGEVLVEGLRHGPAFPCTEEDEGIPVLMPSSTTGFGIDTTKVLYSIGIPKLRDLDFLEPGDIIFARGNKPDQVGNCGLFEGQAGKMTFANLFMRIRVDSLRFKPWFVQYWLMTPGVHDHVRKNTKGTGPSIQKINGVGVRSIPFPIKLDFELQNWWIQHLNQVRNLGEELETKIKDQVQDLKVLVNRVTEEAFNGY